MMLSPAMDTAPPRIPWPRASGQLQLLASAWPGARSRHAEPGDAAAGASPATDVAVPSAAEAAPQCGGCSGGCPVCCVGAVPGGGTGPATTRKPSVLWPPSSRRAPTDCPSSHDEQLRPEPPERDRPDRRRRRLRPRIPGSGAAALGVLMSTCTGVRGACTPAGGVAAAAGCGAGGRRSWGRA